MWAIGTLEVKKRFIEMKDENGALRKFPVTSLSLPLMYNGHHGMTIGLNRGKFSITYPPSVRDVDTDGKIVQWGYGAPRGQKEIENKDTGLDVTILAKRLRDKFGPKFARQIVMAMQA